MNREIAQSAAVLFDLDGTLADTAPDMVAALNRLRAERGLDQIAYAQARPQVSHGSRALVSLGFPDDSPEKIEAGIKRFLDLYAEKVCSGTRLFEGMHEILDRIEDSGRPWGVVTNKPQRFTEPLMEALGLSARAACIVSGDTVSKSKPHAMPLLHACEIMGLPAASCVYIGDAERDIIAGRSAGMRTLAALYGYILDNDNPSSWRADGTINHPAELRQWLGLD